MLDLILWFPLFRVKCPFGKLNGTEIFPAEMEIGKISGLHNKSGKIPVWNT